MDKEIIEEKEKDEEGFIGREDNKNGIEEVLDKENRE